MKQTAVEWLEEEWLNLDLEFTGLLDTKEYDLRRKSIIQQANQMEKERMIDFAKYCLNNAKYLNFEKALFNTEEYYEIFKSAQE